MGFTVKRFKDYIYNELNNESRTRHMNDKAIQFEDAEGRKIKISPDAGVQVEDAEGTIIHDTPDCVIAADMAYGGHIIFKDAPTAITSSDLNYTDTDASRTADSGTLNYDLTSVLPSDITNAKGVILALYHILHIDGVKVKSSTECYSQARYSVTYNTAPGTYNHLSHLHIRSQSLDADDLILYENIRTQATCPIVFNGGTPYITWIHNTYFNNMTAVSANYYAKVYLYLLGFLV